MPNRLIARKVIGWGGKRAGAGRPGRTGLVSHGKRPSVDLKKPLHITLTLKKGLLSLRSSEMLQEFRRAVKESKKFGLSVIQYSLISNQIHLIVEAPNSNSLSRGMKSLTCRLGKLIRKASGGKGPVFLGRFAMHVIQTAVDMKLVLLLLMLNKSVRDGRVNFVDEYSSASNFRYWRELMGERLGESIQNHIGPILKDLTELSTPKSYIGRSAWMRV